MWDGFVDLTINYHTVILRTVEYSSIEIFLEIEVDNNMKLRDMYATISCKEQIFINFEFSLHYEECDIERYFNRDVIAIEALGEHVIGIKIEGYA